MKGGWQGKQWFELKGQLLKSSSITSSGSSKSATSCGSGGGRVATIIRPALCRSYFWWWDEDPGLWKQVSPRVSPSDFDVMMHMAHLQSSLSIYGGGYSCITGSGVIGRRLPFIFWPLAWGGIAGAGAGSTSQNTTFRVVVDNTTAVSPISA